MRTGTRMTRDILVPVKTLIKAAVNDATAWVERSDDREYVAGLEKVCLACA